MLLGNEAMDRKYVIAIVGMVERQQKLFEQVACFINNSVIPHVSLVIEMSFFATNQLGKSHF